MQIRVRVMNVKTYEALRRCKWWLKVLLAPLVVWACFVPFVNVYGVNTSRRAHLDRWRRHADGYRQLRFYVDDRDVDVLVVVPLTRDDMELAARWWRLWLSSPPADWSMRLVFVVCASSELAPRWSVDDNVDVLHLPCRETYLSLADKVRWLLLTDVLTQRFNFAHLWKVDSDVYPCVETLWEKVRWGSLENARDVQYRHVPVVVDGSLPADLVWAGLMERDGAVEVNDTKRWHDPLYRARYPASRSLHVYAAGASYVLSGPLLRRLQDRHAQWPLVSLVNEDVMVGAWVQGLNASRVRLSMRRECWCNPNVPRYGKALNDPAWFKVMSHDAVDMYHHCSWSDMEACFHNPVTCTALSD